MSTERQRYRDKSYKRPHKGVDHPTRYRRGESHHRALLGERDVLLMRELYRYGLSVSEIWRKWDDSPVRWGTVHSAVTGKSWRHLP
jgi:hypothetical protein